MTRQYARKTNQSPQKDTDSSILQRTAVRSLPAKTLTVQTESQAIGSESFKRDLTQIPVSNHKTPVVQPKLMVGKESETDRQQSRPALPEFRGLSSELISEGEARQSDRETPVQRQSEEKKAENKTGLPDRLKEGIESMSGYDLSGVRVNYNSPKPAQLNALAYTQGHAIEVAAGQERHLPHEAWHVVQQMQGRVRPTMEVNGLEVNGDRGLEREADEMGRRAISARRNGCQLTEKSVVTKTGGQNAKGEVFQAYDLVERAETLKIKLPEQLTLVRNEGELRGGQQSDLVIDHSASNKKLDSLIAALQYAAERFGLVARAARTIQLRDGQFGQIDRIERQNLMLPFVYEIIVPFKEGERKQTIQLRYQFAQDSPGYIISQELTGEEEARIINEPIEQGGSGISRGYMAAHGDTKGELLRNMLRQDPNISVLENAERLDARTKLAGEGARFEVVRENMKRMTDDKKIYAITENGGNAKYVTFRDLWLNWRAVFNSQYNIRNQEVAEAILRNNNWVPGHQPKVASTNQKNPDWQKLRSSGILVK